MSRTIAATLLFACTMTVHANCPDLLDQPFVPLKGGDPVNLCQYHGKVLLIVNTASYCGNTPQYKSLETLYKKYVERGLVVLGFPSNDFGRQEPGAAKEIAEFCERTYQITFPMFEKSSVREANGNPLYDRLAELSGARPQWNFHKYLIDRSGKKVQSVGSSTLPDDSAFVKQIEALIAEK